VVCHVPRLLGGDFDKRRLRPADVVLKRPDDAREACSQVLRAASVLRPDAYAAALESAEAFLRLRPASGCGHKILAYANEKLGRKEAALASYGRAVELDPNSLNARLLYAQLLTESGRVSRAGEILEPLWLAGRSRDLVAIAMVNLRAEQGQSAQCFEVLEEAIRFNPRNAYLWQQVGGGRVRTQGPAAGIEPLTRAVELYPERGPMRGSLAQLLETTGNLDQAEKHFRKLLEVEPENPVVYYWLAQFLSRHRPEAVQEALAIAERALDRPLRTRLPREKVEQLIAEIRGRMEPGVQK
jgi:tetratricopeptide (TPR) repeat protein